MVPNDSIDVPIGRIENQEIGNPEPEAEPERNRRKTEVKCMLQVGSMIDIKTLSSLLCIPRKMDDDTRSPFKKC